jgi:hypothetical protein
MYIIKASGWSRQKSQINLTNDTRAKRGQHSDAHQFAAAFNSDWSRSSVLYFTDLKLLPSIVLEQFVNSVAQFQNDLF